VTTENPQLLASEALLAALRCPESQQPLHRATPDELAAFPGEHADGLVREDGTVLYPVRDGFPILLLSEAVRK
jgi:uncharacterized protein YbaR (Trm112 family)